MQVIPKKIEELKAYENNPRNNDGSVNQVANSIKEFGFKVPVVIDKDNVIITGHTRVKAAKKLGMREIPCILADDLSPEQADAFRLADNKVSEFSKWDNGLLQGELDELGAQFDMGDFGFGNSEDVDYDSFLTDTENPEKGPKYYTCPHCGKAFSK